MIVAYFICVTLLTRQLSWQFDTPLFHGLQLQAYAYHIRVNAIKSSDAS
jgi:hypothetical protein